MNNATDSTVPRLGQIPLWPALVHVVLDFVAGIIAFVVVITMLSLSLGLVPLFLVGLPLLLATFAMARRFATMERARFAALLGVMIEAPPDRRYGGFTDRLRHEITSSMQWKAVAYSLLLGITGTMGATLVTSCWGAGIALLALPAYLREVPFHGVVRFAGPVSIGLWMLLGLVLLALAPLLTKCTAWLDIVIGLALLSPGRSAELESRVEDLTRTRSAVVDAADAERRRIERDLHDGAQQRLVALAMNLGRARARFDEDREGARTLLDEAHSDAKLALQELRDLARGLHPAVLSDRGLDAALSALGARSPIPVRMDVDVSERCAASIEAIAYFVVAEALTNVAKHAQATSATVGVRRLQGTLHLRIADNGRGGADVSLGSGLAGLRDRVAAADGSLRITSPVGGPTTLEVTLPCAS